MTSNAEDEFLYWEAYNQDISGFWVTIPLKLVIF